MAKMLEISAADAVRIKVVLSAMKRGKWELEGEEVLAFAQAFGWVADLSLKIKAVLEAPEAPAATVEEEMPG